MPSEARSRRALWCIACRKHIELEPAELWRDDAACITLERFLEAHRTDVTATHLLWYGEAPPPSTPYLE